MNKRAGIAIIITSIVSICISVTALVTVRQSVQNETRDIQYVMYVGTNDKDTNEPVYSEEEARERADVILTRYFEGFTIQEARGGWKNEDGTVSHEYTPWWSS